MKKWSSPAVAWILSAGLWLIIAVDRSGGDTERVAAVNEPVAMPAEGSAADSVPPAGEAVTAAPPVDACIPVNTATAEQLDALPGIGPVIAERIIAYREAHGPFKRMADIERVKGIGPATIKKFGAKICF